MEREVKDFYDKPTADQWKLVDEKVTKYKDEILSSDPMTINFAGDTAGTGKEQTQGANNPADGAQGQEGGTPPVTEEPAGNEGEPAPQK